MTADPSGLLRITVNVALRSSFPTNVNSLVNAWVAACDNRIRSEPEDCNGIAVADDPSSTNATPTSGSVESTRNHPSAPGGVESFVSAFQSNTVDPRGGIVIESRLVA
jgi:hypothetical protein